jgi:hypothetical protein
MQIVFQNHDLSYPRVSIVLLDWSCRESFHVLDYLAEQTVPRESYEVIWIEYYSRQAPQINRALEKCRIDGKPPLVDQWVVMGVPDNVYYHKHLMYNVGILLSKGRLVVICDSDAILRSTFVESIVRSFEVETNAVLHLDQVRNNLKRFYPFNFPMIEEVIGAGAVNWRDGRTTGLWDTEDTPHTRNYGACFAALREDLISIGGADEHMDFLGHICGPYDMTFRLLNHGRKEIWSDQEFLYHVWHPGQSGEMNYLGPNDGRDMSTTALETRASGRILPHVENPAIRLLRLRGGNVPVDLLLSVVFSDHTLKGWSIDSIKGKISESLKRRPYLRRVARKLGLR